jgi:hypothetical protein
MATRVFISYRRDESAAHAGRVYDRLAPEFGRGSLFMDVDAVRLGANFVQVLRDEVAKCDVLLAIIGPNWLNARDEAGNRRLDNQEDFVRIEIATALQRDIPVIPILFDGAKIPKADQLPTDLEDLTNRNGVNVRNATFHSDIAPLIRELEGLSKTASTSRAAERPKSSRKATLTSESIQLLIGTFLSLMVLAAYAKFVSSAFHMTFLTESPAFMIAPMIVLTAIMLYLRQKMFEIPGWIAYTLVGFGGWWLSVIIGRGAGWTHATYVEWGALYIVAPVAFAFAVFRIRHRTGAASSD